LTDHTKITGTDLSKTPFATAIEQLNSPEAILQLLHERAKAFEEYRDGNRKLISCRPGSEGLSGILGHSKIPIPPANALFVGFDTLLAVRPFDTLFDRFPCDE